jgi:hypothetical protein
VKTARMHVREIQSRRKCRPQPASEPVARCPSTVTWPTVSREPEAAAGECVAQ